MPCVYECMTAVRTAQGMFWQPCTYCGDMAVTGLDLASGIDRPGSFVDEYREPDNASPVAGIATGGRPAIAHTALSDM
jgi:hypothetical protein